MQFVGLGADTLARLRRIETLRGLARFSEFIALLHEFAQWRDYRLLASTRQRVSSICCEVGFNNISNFNRHFRRIKGMTPGEFRGSRM